MKLFLITQTENNGYDTYDSAVVAAQNEENARKMHPSGHNEGWEYSYTPWASSPDKVTVIYIGEAAEGMEQHVICASFNAG